MILLTQNLRKALRRSAYRVPVSAALLASGLLSTAAGQDAADRYFPLRHDMPPGDAARMHAFSRRVQHVELQPVEVTLPSTGKVTFFHGAALTPIETPAPGQLKVLSGYTYRLRISHMPEFPGIELYPTVEVLDQLRPPAGQENNFPIPIMITEEEIRTVLQGRMIKKVIYVEQPQVASSLNPQSPEAIEDFAAETNLFVEADKRGRPLLLLRLGGRQPSQHGHNDGFFFTSGPIQLNQAAPAAPAASGN